jgi:hypothetical protein
VARYGTELRSRYIGNKGGDNDGSEPVTAADLFSPGPNHVEDTLRNQYLRVGAIDTGPGTDQAPNPKQQCACAAKLVQVDGCR